MDSEITPEKPFGLKCRVAIVALVLSKLWLTAGLKMVMLASGYDDLLFLRLAGSLLSAKWLGPYNHVTLAKGPVYPFYIWAVFISGVPLYTAFQLGYAISCVVLICALRPFCSSRAVLLALFTVLLFNPITFENSMARVLRQTLTPSLVLLILSSLIALHGCRNSSLKKLLGWSFLFGITFTAFWMDREDSIWFAPTVAPLLAIVAWDFWRQRRTRPVSHAILVLGLPLVVFCLGVGTVSFLNWRYYGVFTYSEFRCKDFKDAYGALVRVKPDKWSQFIPVSRKTREEVYAVSPAFAELRPYLEGTAGLGWAANSAPVTHLPPEDLEVAGGWWVWDLRNAVAASGHAGSARQAMAFYRKIADEVNAACDRHLLQAGPPRSGFLPRLGFEYWVPFRRSFRGAFRCVFLFKGMSPIPLQSSGSPEDIRLFKDLAWNDTSPVAGEPLLNGRQEQMNKRRLAVLLAVTHAYGKCAPWLGLVSLCCLLASLGLGIRLRKISYLSVLSLSLLGGCLALMVIVALIDCTSGPAVCCSYLCGDYELYLLCIFTSCLALFETLSWAREKRSA